MTLLAVKMNTLPSAQHTEHPHKFRLLIKPRINHCSPLKR